MGKISADANSLPEGVQSRAISPGLLIIEVDMLMDEIANRLDSAPARSDRPKFRPSKTHEFAINFAITAGQKKSQCDRWHLTHRLFSRVRSEKVRFTIVPNQGVITQTNYPGRRIQPSATIAERIQIILDRENGFSMEIFRHFQSGLTRGMDA